MLNKEATRFEELKCEIYDPGSQDPRLPLGALLPLLDQAGAVSGFLQNNLLMDNNNLLLMDNNDGSGQDLHAVGHGLVVPFLLALSTPALRFLHPPITCSALPMFFCLFSKCHLERQDQITISMAMRCE